MVDVAHVEELFAGLFANVDAVPAGIDVFGERADVFPLGIEHDGRVHHMLAVPLMRDIDQPGFVDRHAVGRFPTDVARQFAPAVDAFVAEFARADDRILGAGFVFHPEQQGAGTS